MSDTAIKVENLSKMYHIGGQQEKYKTFRDLISTAIMSPIRKTQALLKGQAATDQTVEMWALRDLSFEIKHGEVIGVIGRNGAGKSTLLKILSRITEPTTGYVDIFGKVGALLEVGTGFHPELTGRENVYLNGAILGMSRHEINHKFDEIIDFAGIDKFVDTPVKHYSSGMGLRLGFAVAAHLEPDILIVDEVLAVGDQSFQKKCLNKMSEVSQQGRTVLLVSHNMSAIMGLSQHSLVLDKGKFAFFGETEKAIKYYLQYNSPRNAVLDERIDRNGTGAIKLKSITLLDKDMQTTTMIPSGETMSLAFEFETAIKDLYINGIMLDVHVNDIMGQRILTFSTRFDKASADISYTKSGTLTCLIPSILLAESTYTLDIWLAYKSELCDEIRAALEFDIVASDFYGTGNEPIVRKHGSMVLKHKWQFQEHN